MWIACNLMKLLLLFFFPFLKFRKKFVFEYKNEYIFFDFFAFETTPSELTDKSSSSKFLNALGWELIFWNFRLSVPSLLLKEGTTRRLATFIEAKSHFKQNSRFRFAARGRTILCKKKMMKQRCRPWTEVLKFNLNLFVRVKFLQHT